MNTRILFCAAVLSLGLASTASAADRTFAFTAAAGTTSADSANLGGLSPKGVVLDLTGSVVLFEEGDLVVSATTGATLGPVEASEQYQF